MMNESLFSTYWYRVSNLKPMLRDTAMVSRHIYRGQHWYVLRNTLNNRNQRFNAAAYAILGQMDGQRTVQEIWENACEQLADSPPTQDDIIRLLGRVHDTDLIKCDVLPSSVVLGRKHRGVKTSGWKQHVTNPFSHRIPLVDPDRFLEKWVFLTAPLFTRKVFIVWVLFVASALVTAGMHWPELTENLSDRLLSPTNLMMLWLVFPLVKLFHEFGHAFAVKLWGGEVHQMGIMFLLLTPIPYVDASTSASFPDKWHRISVSAMGMMVELFLASCALFVWLNVETGLISAIAYNVMLICGVSTVLFNGNPLLRYDGYYVLADLIEIPNLSQRSIRYFGYLVQRYLLGVTDSNDSPVTAPGEKGWFIVYGPVSFCYRIAVLIGMAIFISSRFFLIGVLIAIWGAVTLMLVPAIRNIIYVFNRSAFHNRRNRMTGLLAGFLLMSLIFLFLVPFPLWTTTQGVVWMPEQSVIRAGTYCKVAELLAPAEEFVAEGAPLIRGEAPFLKAKIEVQKAGLEELYARYNSHPLHERVERRILTEEIELAKKDLHHAEEDLKKLVILSPSYGKLILVDAMNLPGRYVKKGELLGYVIAEHRPTVRAVISQADIDLVRKRLTGVSVRLAERLSRPLSAELVRVIPSADHKLPSAALGNGCGGIIPVDPSDPEGLQALTTIFQVDITLPDVNRDAHIGGRVYVRFEHGTMPLALQWYRSLHQLFIRKFYA